MKKLTTSLALAAFMFVAPAFAMSHNEAPGATPAASCEATAAEKKLAGAAKTSFLKKCNKTAHQSECDTRAGEKKLAGAAKTSFLKKCNADSAAMAASGAASASK
ncbi:MAG: hypothetical protein WCJ87_09810 [Burkholderiales bacterium]